MATGCTERNQIDAVTHSHHYLMPIHHRLASKGCIRKSEDYLLLLETLVGGCGLSIDHSAFCEDVYFFEFPSH